MLILLKQIQKIFKFIKKLFTILKKNIVIIIKHKIKHKISQYKTYLKTNLFINRINWSTESLITLAIIRMNRFIESIEISTYAKTSIIDIIIFVF